MSNKLAIKLVECPCDNGKHKWAIPGRKYNPSEFNKHCTKHYHMVFMYNYEKELWKKQTMEYESIIKRLKAKLKNKNKKILLLTEENYKLLKNDNIPVESAMNIN